ncbi:MAG: amidohydrolase family protein [Acidobacteria bacterium]|nr:amidohydrolase family protein [Acidobacteriota bacterium]
MRILLGILTISVAQLSAQSEVIAIRGARVVDGTGAPATAAIVVIQNHRIAAVGKTVSIPRDARVIDATGQTLIPGLFDLHTHLRNSAAPGGRLAADWGKNLAAHLAAGVTSVGDFGNYGEMFEPMRRLMQNGTVVAPRVHLAIRFSSPGGHGTEGGQGEMFTFVAATAQQAHAAMRTALQYKPALIKVFTDGWRYGSSPNLMSMNEETLAAIVEDAHRAGIKVVTHTVSLENARLAVRAGVDALAHGIQDRQIDEEFIQLIKAKGTGYISTLAVYEPRNHTEVFPGMHGLLEPAIQQLMKGPSATAEQQSSNRLERWHRLQHNANALFKAGVLLGNGTDAGMAGAYHGWAALRELELGTKTGLTPLQAITVATRNSAVILGVDRDLGTIQAGKLADLVLIAGKPDEQIEDIYKTSRVFLNGREYDAGKLREGIQSDRMTKLPTRPVGPMVDDFERSDGRTRLDTLPMSQYDSGIDRSTMQFTRVWRKGNDHSLMVQATMGPKTNSFVQLRIPLTPGALELADISGYKAVSFDARGEGKFRLRAAAYGIRRGGDFSAPFEAGGDWRTVIINFSSLAQSGNSARWTGQDIRELLFELSAPAGGKAWLELDNIRFQ